MALYSIGVKNLEVWSPTGIHADEKMLKVKLVVSARLSYQEAEHLPVSLHATFDYARFVEILNEICSQPHNLIEQVANDIIQRMRPIVDRPCQLHLHIEKKNPMANKTLQSAYVDVIEELSPGKVRRGF